MLIMQLSMSFMMKPIKQDLAKDILIVMVLTKYTKQIMKQCNTLSIHL